MQKVLSMNTYRASTFGSKAFSFVKRSFDILGSLALIVLLFPLCLVVADFRSDPDGAEQCAVPYAEIPHNERGRAKRCGHL